MFKGVQKEDFRVVLEELGEKVSDDARYFELKDQILATKAYSDDPESVHDLLNNAVDDRRQLEEREFELYKRKLEWEHEIELEKIRVAKRKKMFISTEMVADKLNEPYLLTPQIHQLLTSSQGDESSKECLQEVAARGERNLRSTCLDGQVEPGNDPQVVEDNEIDEASVKGGREVAGSKQREDENPTAGQDDGGLEYNEDGNLIAPAAKSKCIDPPPSLDQSEIQCDELAKNFNEVIGHLFLFQVEQLRHKLKIRLFDPATPKVVSIFAHFEFDEKMMKSIRKPEYAKTNFLCPLLVHIKELESGEGSIGLILAPTREISQQIETDAKRFGKVYGINVVYCLEGRRQVEADQDTSERRGDCRDHTWPYD